MTTRSIALVRQRYAVDGGAERFVSRALEALRARQLGVTLVTREWIETPGFEVVRCNPYYIGRWWRDWSFARSVCRALATQRYDLVQSHERLACCDVYRAGDGVHREWLAQRQRVLGPVARWAQRLSPYHQYVRAAERRLFESPRLKAVICNSRMVRDEIKQYFGLPDEKLPVIYSGVDTAAFHPDLNRHRSALRERYGIPEADTLFLFVGSGFERKGVRPLIEAFAGLPRSAQLIVVGRDRRLGNYAERAVRLGLGGRVHFAGAQADVKPYYGAADALVLPTLYDPFPNVALEAMASGLPIVTSTKCGAAELVREGENGFVCDALDVDGLRAAMQSLGEPGRAVDMGRAARATVAPYDLARMTGELVALYERLLAGR